MLMILLTAITGANKIKAEEILANTNQQNQMRIF